jgi:hypothetical protein
MPSTAQHEATIPVEVFVQSDANSLFHKTIHIARCSVRNDGVAEVLETLVFSPFNKFHGW